MMRLRFFGMVCFIYSFNYTLLFASSHEQNYKKVCILKPIANVYQNYENIPVNDRKYLFEPIKPALLTIDKMIENQNNKNGFKKQNYDNKENLNINHKNGIVKHSHSSKRHLHQVEVGVVSQNIEIIKRIRISEA